MSWLKLDDKAPRHPKVASLTDRAFRWWIQGLCYASEFLTNGLLPPIFWKQVPKQNRAELTDQRLWDWDDPNYQIHDYLSHQSSRETVAQKKADNVERVTRYREKKRNALQASDCNAVVTPPDTENREQITDTENRTTTPSSSHGPALVMSPKEFDRLRETHAFIGSKLRVPKVLHFELLGKSGADAERELQRWYLQLNDQLEESGKGTGDVFAWLRPRHQSYAILKGWIEPAPKPQAVSNKPRPIAEILAERERKSS